MQQHSTCITLSALQLVIGLGWIPSVTSLQLTCLQVLIDCRCSREFRLRVARKTPHRVWHVKLGGKCRGRKPPERSARLSVPKVTRMIYDRRSFVELDEGWTLPKELLRLVLGTEFDGEIEGVVWPSALESVVFWRRYPRVFFEMRFSVDSFSCSRNSRFYYFPEELFVTNNSRVVITFSTLPIKPSILRQFITESNSRIGL